MDEKFVWIDEFIDGVEVEYTYDRNGTKKKKGKFKEFKNDIAFANRIREGEFEKIYCALKYIFGDYLRNGIYERFLESKVKRSVSKDGRYIIYKDFESTSNISLETYEEYEALANKLETILNYYNLKLLIKELGMDFGEIKNIFELCKRLNDNQPHYVFSSTVKKAIFGLYDSIYREYFYYVSFYKMLLKVKSCDDNTGISKVKEKFARFLLNSLNRSQLKAVFYDFNWDEFECELNNCNCDVSDYVNSLYESIKFDVDNSCYSNTDNLSDNQINAIINDKLLTCINRYKSEHNNRLEADPDYSEFIKCAKAAVSKISETVKEAYECDMDVLIDYSSLPDDWSNEFICQEELDFLRCVYKNICKGKIPIAKKGEEYEILDKDAINDIIEALVLFSSYSSIYYYVNKSFAYLYDAINDIKHALRCPSASNINYYIHVMDVGLEGYVELCEEYITKEKIEQFEKSLKKTYKLFKKNILDSLNKVLEEEDSSRSSLEEQINAVGEQGGE